jgi:hypothetical protein
MPEMPKMPKPPSTSPVLPRHPLDRPGLVKILLGHAASTALARAGDHFLVIASRADATAGPENRGRFVLLCLAIPQAAANDAAQVAMGMKRAAAVRRSRAGDPGQG